jgi:general L-amino acid transport system substrate-binding protein
MPPFATRFLLQTFGFGFAIVFALSACANAQSQTLKSVKERGAVACGVSQGVIGFSVQSENGEWTGIDADLCRALAAAIFDDASKVRFVPLSADDRFQALRSMKIDVLSRNSTWTISPETELGLAFVGVNFYDRQGLMVRRARNVASALELDASRICVQRGTTTEFNLRDYFAAYGIRYQPVAAGTADEALKAYESGQCDVLTADASALHGHRLKTAQPSDHDILPDVLSKEPLGPVVRQDDFEWFNIVKWTNFAMLNAEELGVSSHTLDDALRSTQPDLKRLLGSEGSFGERMGLTRDWVVRIVRRVGNYAEVYDRNVGVGSKLRIPRGINQLWTNGGILYAPPIR